MLARIAEFQSRGLILRRQWRGTFTIAYREILTAEGVASGFGLRLHTRTSEPVRVVCRRGMRLAIEQELRRRGVRVVDELGAIIAPNLDDFERELARGPTDVRQSSDNA